MEYLVGENHIVKLIHSHSLNFHFVVVKMFFKSSFQVWCYKKELRTSEM